LIFGKAHHLFHRFHFNKDPDMSQHNSFKASGGGGKKNRTVLKRFERVELLRKRGQWEDGNRVVGLRKTKPEE
jgi:small basic protein (TIGR04137 family)